jgi:hypothetical protein
VKHALTLLAALLLASWGALPAAVAGVQSVQPDLLLTNRKAWEDFGARGNPLLLLNTERIKAPQAAFKPPEKVPNTWTYRVIAEQLVPAAYAATAQPSPHRGRADLVAHCVAVADWLTQPCDANGLWYRREGSGDPNVNRFTLGPLADRCGAFAPGTGVVQPLGRTETTRGGGRIRGFPRGRPGVPSGGA